MHEQFVQEDRWHGIRFINGLLRERPAVSLRLSAFDQELYSDDLTGTPIENLIPTTASSTKSNTSIQ